MENEVRPIYVMACLAVVVFFPFGIAAVYWAIKVYVTNVLQQIFWIPEVQHRVVFV